ncbi:MAG: IS1595 family transposase [Terracidiphilus sp.]|jgi:transposase-like protein
MEPKTLQDAILYFADPINCREYLVARRWPKGVTCPRCESKNVLFLEKYNRWHCREKHTSSQFTLKTGTVMEDSPIGLDKWLTALWMVVNCKNGVSSYEIHRTLGVTQKSAWFLDHRIRLMLEDEYRGKLSGTIEMDETFVGGKLKNMHKSKKPKGTGFSGRAVGAMAKTIVVGMLERNGRVRAEVVKERTQEVLQQLAKDNVQSGNAVVTDEWGGYKGLSEDFLHVIVNHAVEYVNGQIHTQGIENFWSLLKRGLTGTYIAVEPFHLFRYIDEQAFRYNNRKLTDAQRFDIATRGMVGKRLTLAELTGKASPASSI